VCHGSRASRRQTGREIKRRKWRIGRRLARREKGTSKNGEARKSGWKKGTQNGSAIKGRVCYVRNKQSLNTQRKREEAKKPELTKNAKLIG